MTTPSQFPMSPEAARLAFQNARKILRASTDPMSLREAEALLTKASQRLARIAAKSSLRGKLTK